MDAHHDKSALPGSPSPWMRAAAWIGGKVQTIWFPVMALVFLAAIIPTTTAGWFAVRQFSMLSREKVEQDLRARANTWREEVEGWFGAPILSLQAVNSSLLVKEVVGTLVRGPGDPGFSKARADLNRFFSYLIEGKTAIRGFAFFDSAGKLIHQQPAGVLSGIAPIAMPPGLGTTPVMMAVESGGRHGLVALQRVTGEDGATSAVVAAYLNLAPLADKMQKKDAAGPLAYLVNRDGHLVAGGGEGGQDPGGEGLADMLSRGKVAEFTGVGSARAVGVALPLKGLPWSLVAEIPWKDARGAVDEFRKRMTWLAVSFAVVLLVPGLLLARTIVVPLVAMSRTARSIVGESRLGLQVETRAWGEMKELMAAFNTMSRSLFQSMEALRASNEEFRRLSITDPLTGRHNRRYMEDTLVRDLKQAKRFSQPLSVIMVDIDHFKRFNDRFGHLAGDEALKGISAALSINIRDSDVMARWGGEEFLVSLVQTDKPGAINAAEKLRVAVEKLAFQFKGKRAHLTISCGVATFEEDGRSIDELLEASDQALYLAKDGGRNRVCAFSGPPPTAPIPSGPRNP
jgi:diguanylate cyclase (GGDEF)-like protein